MDTHTCTSSAIADAPTDVAGCSRPGPHRLVRACQPRCPTSRARCTCSLARRTCQQSRLQPEEKCRAARRWRRSVFCSIAKFDLIWIFFGWFLVRWIFLLVILIKWFFYGFSDVNLLCNACSAPISLTRSEPVFFSSFNPIGADCSQNLAPIYQWHKSSCVLVVGLEIRYDWFLTNNKYLILVVTEY